MQVHYEGIYKIDAVSGERAETVDEVQEAVVQCLDCMHDQPHLGFVDGRVEPVEDRWERMVTGTPWVASCTVTVNADRRRDLLGPGGGRRALLRRLRRPRRPRVLHARPLPQARRRPDDHRAPARRALRALAGGGDRGTRERRPGLARDHLAGGGVTPACSDGRRTTLAATPARLRRPASLGLGAGVTALCPRASGRNRVSRFWAARPS